MNKAPLNIRLPEDLKQEATDVLQTMGLTPSSAVRIFLTQVVKDKSIPFPISGNTGNQTQQKRWSNHD